MQKFIESLGFNRLTPNYVTEGEGRIGIARLSQIALIKVMQLLVKRGID
jgi:hypothetical protein